MKIALKKISLLFLYLFGALVAFIIGVIVFNFIIMPHYVKLGDEVIVPEFAGMNYEEANAVAKKTGLDLFTSKYMYDMVTPKGQIISQTPIPGQYVKRNSRIRITISKGAEKIFSPDLSNMPLSQAKMNLETMNLEIGKIEYIYHDDFLQNIVIRNFPPPNTPIARKTLITLIVSRGPIPKTILVPNFIGQSFEDVKEEIINNGLSLGNIVYQDNEKYLPETVINQSKSPGQ